MISHEILSWKLCTKTDSRYWKLHTVHQPYNSRQQKKSHSKYWQKLDKYYEQKIPTHWTDLTRRSQVFLTSLTEVVTNSLSMRNKLILTVVREVEADGVSSSVKDFCETVLMNILKRNFFGASIWLLLYFVLWLLIVIILKTVLNTKSVHKWMYTSLIWKWKPTCVCLESLHTYIIVNSFISHKGSLNNT